MKSRFPILLALLSLLPLPAMAATQLPTSKPAAEKAAPLDPAKKAAGIVRIEKYITGLTTVVADFTQIAPDGTLTSGKFYLKRPGRMRWQYNPPTPILIISDGKALVYYDHELEQVSNVPLDDSLINLLGRENVTFTDGVKVDSYSEGNSAIRIQLSQADKPGSLLLEFSDAPLLLRNLVVTDASGQITSVSLQNARFGVPLSKDLFIFTDPRKRRKL